MELQFELVSVEEKVELVGRRLLPVQGYAQHLLSSLQEGIHPYKTLTEATQRELAQYAAAFAYSTSSRLFDTDREVDKKKHSRNFLADDPSLVVGAAKMILGEYFDHDAIVETLKWARSCELNKMPVPSSLSHLLPTIEQEKQGAKNDWKLIWARHTQVVTTLAQLILAFAAVGDLSQCKNAAIGDVLLEFYADNYVGKGDVGVLQNSWFDLVSDLLRGERKKLDIDINSWCLRSHHGWTLYK